MFGDITIDDVVGCLAQAGGEPLTMPVDFAESYIPTGLGGRKQAINPFVALQLLEERDRCPPVACLHPFLGRKRWIVEASSLTVAGLDVGICFASSLTGLPDVD